LGVRSLALGVPVIIVECIDILQEIVGWGRGKELRGSKIVVTPVENGDIPQGVAPTPLQEFQGGWEQGCSINIRDKEEVGSTEDKNWLVPPLRDIPRVLMF
jgi:hypothetical protein